MTRLLCVCCLAGLLLLGCNRSQPEDPAADAGGVVPVTTTDDDSEPVAVEADEPIDLVVLAIYHADDELAHLQAEALELDPDTAEDPALAARAAATAWLAGPTEPGLAALAPAGTTLREVTVAGAVATVDLSGEFVTGYTGGSNLEALVVYSLVNSVASVPGIDQVQITAAGETPRLHGELDLSAPLLPDPSLLGGEPL